MYLKRLEVSGFKSFSGKSELTFDSPITGVVGPNGSGKSNIAEALRFVLGEQSMKSMRTARGEDLIFGGSPSAGRMNRAVVTAVFDNSEGAFGLEYNEAVISREVARDGTSKYLVNGSTVRLKDVMEMLASARVGSSQHQVISQGEADRMLEVAPDRRRQMIEDALGLRIYQFKMDEASRKLAKTHENIGEIETLQRELAPQLKFLERQVEEIHQLRALKEELVELAKNYFAKKQKYLSGIKKRATEEKDHQTRELNRIEAEVSELKHQLDEEGRKEQSESSSELTSIDRELVDIRQKKQEYTRQLGRLEGLISKREEAQQKKDDEGSKHPPVEYQRVADLGETIQYELSTARELEEVSGLRAALERIGKALNHFFEHEASRGADEKDLDEQSEDHEQHEAHERERARLEQESKELDKREKSLVDRHAELGKQLENEYKQSRQLERTLSEKHAERTQASSGLERAQRRLDELSRERESFEHDLSEFSFLLGKEVLRYEEKVAEASEEQNPDTLERELISERRELERKRARVEQMGTGDEEVITEYENLKQRKQFLEREKNDLEESQNSLEKLTHDLERELDEDFQKGLVEINKQFQHFFELMFGGGSAKLELEKVTSGKKKTSEASESVGDQEASEGSTEAQSPGKRGLVVRVSMPHKRVKSVEMLSGGERSLTSIALLFAVSQVKPPPFLVLDEMDAALDEENSRRYGQMLSQLAQKTQLVIITHNRETMSRANVLYGVTMGRDAVSKILSVKLEDAQENAAR